MKSLASLLFCLAAFGASAQDGDEGPTLEVLIAAADAGNGRAALMVYERLKGEDLVLATYFVQLAFKDATPGACAGLLEALALRGALQKTRPNNRAGAVTLCSVRDQLVATPNAPLKLSAYELPHAAKALQSLGYWDGGLPQMGRLPPARTKRQLEAALKDALSEPRVRQRIQEIVRKIGAELRCDRAARRCRATR